MYLKRLPVAGFERVYEIARCFRNEGIDRRHNPEFTQVELYAAYWDYKDLMKFVERMIKTIVEEVKGNLEVEFNNMTIDFSEFEHWEVPRKIKELTWIDVNQLDFEGLREEAEKLGLNVSDCNSWGEIVEKIRDEILEKGVEKSTFMYSISERG